MCERCERVIDLSFTGESAVLWFCLRKWGSRLRGSHNQRVGISCGAGSSLRPCLILRRGRRSGPTPGVFWGPMVHPSPPFWAVGGCISPGHIQPSSPVLFSLIPPPPFHFHEGNVGLMGSLLAHLSLSTDFRIPGGIGSEIAFQCS